MNLFNLFRKESDGKALYKLLCTETYTKYPNETEDLGEDMALVSQVIREYWKPRFLLNRKTECAYEFMDKNEKLVTVVHEDIAWETLSKLPNKAIERAQNLSFHFPSFIGKFENGVSEVSWQINPDGHYFMSEEGFGMTDDEEMAIYGFINKKGKVLLKFQTIKDYEDLKLLRTQAERKVNKKFWFNF